MSRQSSGLTSREAGRLSDLLAKWTEVDNGLLGGGDRDAIGQLRHLLEDELDARMQTGRWVGRDAGRAD